MNIDKIITDIFDLVADTVGKVQSSKAKAIPDISDIKIDHLISEEEMSDVKKLYAASDDVPDIDFRRTARLPLLDIYDGEYPSKVQTSFPENNTVYVKHYRLRPEKKGRPVVIMVNGLHLDNNFYFDWWCWRFAAWGLDSVLITMPFSQQRVPEGSFSGQYTFLADTTWNFMVLKQSFSDTQLFANWLKANGWGDIGTFGVSFGALISGIYVCQARNAHFTILGMPPVDIVDLLGRWDFGEELKKHEARGEKTMLTDRRFHKAINMSEMQPEIPLKNIFIGKGIYDRLVPPETIDLTAERWGPMPWLQEYPTGHINTFVFNRRFIKDARRFIKSEIV